jgi:hypothetical protein
MNHMVPTHFGPIVETGVAGPTLVSCASYACQMPDKKVPLSELSDEALIARLKKKAKDKSWSVAEVIEVERRGYQVLDSEPEIRDAIKSQLSASLELMKNVLEPQLKQFQELRAKTLGPSSDVLRKLAGDIAGQNLEGFYQASKETADKIKGLTSYAFPSSLAYQFPRAITADPYLMSQPLESPQVRQALLQEQMLEVQRETVELMSALVKLSKRSWFEWTLWGFALVAAVVGLIALFAK